jgi:competence protein ComEA
LSVTGHFVGSSLMDAAPSPVGIATTSPTPSPEWPRAMSGTPSTADLSVRLSDAAPVWSRPAQAAAAVLLLLAVGLLGWQTYAAGRWSCRPTLLEPGDDETAFLDLNEADHAQLLQLPGVGDNLAQRIEAYRAEHNGFRNVEELRQVRGIGPNQLEKMRPFVRVVPRPDTERVEPEQPAPPRSLGPKPRLTQPININQASREDLQRLPGIGPKLAQRIVDVRAKKPFQSVDDLRRVPGLGARKVEALRPHVVVGP